MGSTWRLGKPFGIPVEFDISGVIVAVVMAFTLATSAFPSQFPEFDSLTYLFLGAGASLLLYGSVLVHELSHALVARRDGLAVDGILLFAFGGIAKLAEEPRTAREEFRMAAAGPACSLVIGIGLMTSVILLSPQMINSPLLALMAYLAAINIALGLFNLLPGFPLDGGRIFRALLWGTTHDLRRATWASAALGQAVALLLICWGLLRLYQGFQNLLVPSGLLGGLFLIFTGVFLAEAARRSYQMVAQRERVAVTVEDERDRN